MSIFILIKWFRNKRPLSCYPKKKLIMKEKVLGFRNFVCGWIWIELKKLNTFEEVSSLEMGLNSRQMGPITKFSLKFFINLLLIKECELKRVIVQLCTKL